MRVWIQYKRGDETGKGKFLQRLMPALERLGVTCQDNPKHADVALGILRWRDEVPKGMPKVLRVDGCYLWSTKRTLWRNKLQRKSIKESDGIIWQSEFCRRVVPAILNVKVAREHVIFNGADPAAYDCLEPLPMATRYNVVCGARWEGRPNKRLEDCLTIARGVTSACEAFTFWFAGMGTEGIQAERVHGFGHLGEAQLRRLLASSDVMLNLSYADWCPNAVVEALAAGCQVVCNNETGAAELVTATGMGTVIQCDPLLELCLSGTRKPPDISAWYEVICRLVTEVAVRPPQSQDQTPIHIDTVAAQYKAAFEEYL